MSESAPPYELTVERFIAAPPETIWTIMTTRMPDWFCPKPWTVEVIEQDWRPGGRSALAMLGPDGERMPQEGVFLDVTPNRGFTFTDAFSAGWVPQGPFMVGFFELTPEGDGTRYRAGARHWTREAYEQHQAMGFQTGWGAVADQLAGLAEAS